MNGWLSRSSVLGAPENQWYKATVDVACVWSDDHGIYNEMVFTLEVVCEDTKKKVACIVRDFRILNYARMQKIHGEGHTFIFDFSSHANLKSRDNKEECVTTVPHGHFPSW